jgi:hypothetical protein
MRKIGKWILVGCVVLLIWWVVYTPITRENFLVKGLVVTVFFTVIAPIMTFYFKARMKYGSKKDKVVKKQIDMSQYQAIKKIYKEEREQYYQEARTLFHDLAKSGSLTKQDLNSLRMFLEDLLGEYVHEFDGFEHEETVNGKKVMKKGFCNDYHRLYCYLKSYYLNENDWKKIISFLKSFENTKEKSV